MQVFHTLNEKIIVYFFEFYRVFKETKCYIYFLRVIRYASVYLCHSTSLKYGT